MNIQKILGVKIDNLEKNEILEKVEYFLNENKFHQVATVNPEFILEAQRNRKFKEVLNGCDLNIVDGVGIKMAFWKHGKSLKYHFSGADLSEIVLKMAEDRGMGVFLACKKGGLSTFDEVKKALLKKYPKLSLGGDNIDINKKYDLLNTTHQILLCNFGAPEQEFFIQSQKNDIIRLGIGVGGTFDFWAGKVKRAPIYIQKIGMEWMWRFFKQPKRFKRIFRAVMIFPIRVIFNK